TSLNLKDEILVDFLKESALELKSRDYPYTYEGSYLDDPLDQNGIQVGIDLWNNNGYNIHPNNLFNEMYKLHNNYGYEHIA
ncbi:MAG: hypothetical protein COX81_01300, partial [Candidatus Magasanikbacteria bacterium CG_4_10_14_0_2_um_filter_37_12]